MFALITTKLSVSIRDLLSQNFLLRNPREKNLAEEREKLSASATMTPGEKTL